MIDLIGSKFKMDLPHWYIIGRQNTLQLQKCGCQISFHSGKRWHVVHVCADSPCVLIERDGEAELEDSVQGVW